MGVSAETVKVDKKAVSKVQLKKVDIETAKLLNQIKEKANKKSFGRKVKDSEIIRAAIKLIGAGEINKLQEATYSEQDRLRIVHENYQKQNGKVSLDQFIGKLMRGEIQPS
ncbi:MAG: hypothetical protein EOP06_08655 [Proteobacteria bacterium]|nr:MAG: hypothetical protein EOP06_08655 [Pseudomonadota bacterium]